MDTLAWLLVAVPTALGAVLAIAGRRADRAAPFIGVAGAAFTLVLAGLAAALRPAASAPLFIGVDAGLGVDGLSAVLVVTVAAVTLAVLVFSIGDLGPDEARARFFGLMLLFAGAMMLTVTATTLAPLLMGWEVMGATSWALIGFWWREPHRVAAATTAFLTTRAGDLGLYVASGAALAGGAGSLRLDALAGIRSPWLNVLVAGVVLAALGKSAQLPFSFWLSRAMAGPSPVSALLHSATMVAAGAYLLLRLAPLLAASGWGATTVAWIGALTAVLLGLVALAQRDLKQLLAASTCAQIGFMVLAAGAGGIAGGVTTLVAHAATKSLLFLGAGAWLSALGTRQLVALRGAARRHRLVGVTFTVGALTLAGLPPLSLWVSKDELLAAALARNAPLYVVGLAAAVISAFYSVRALWYLWTPLPADAEADYDTERAGTRVVPLPARVPLAVLAAFAAGLGALGVPPVADAIRRSLDVPGEPGPHAWELTLSALLALAAAAAAWWWGNRVAPIPLGVQTALADWLGLERAAHAVLVRPTVALAGALAAFDDRVVDGAVRSVARGGVRAAQSARRLDDLGVDGLVAVVAGGTRRLGRYARRPQTGQLHQYYAQAAAVLALLALIVVFVR